MYSFHKIQDLSFIKYKSRVLKEHGYNAVYYFHGQSWLKDNIFIVTELLLIKDLQTEANNPIKGVKD